MTRRLQLLLDEERYERVAAEAKRQRVSVATVIRDAIDHSLEPRRRDKRTSLEVLDLVSSDRLQATTTPEAIQEFAHVRARHHPRADSMRLAGKFADLLGPLRCSEEEHLIDGLDLWSRYESLGAFDAVLAAVALDSKYATLVSADTAFSQVRGLHHVLPDADGIDELVGSK